MAEPDRTGEQHGDIAGGTQRDEVVVDRPLAGRAGQRRMGERSGEEYLGGADGFVDRDTCQRGEISGGSADEEHRTAALGERCEVG